MLVHGKVELKAKKQAFYCICTITVIIYNKKLLRCLWCTYYGKQIISSFDH